MDASEQAADQLVRIAFMGAEYSLRLSGAATKNLAAALWSVVTTKQKTKGKARLQSMLKSGKELKVFNITQAELSTFAKEAKRYGVLYAVIKNAKDNPTSRVDVMVKAEDAAKINRVIERLEYGRYDATDVVVEAKRDLGRSSLNPQKQADKSNDPTQDKVEAKREADELLHQLLNPKQGKREIPTTNPTIPLPDAVSPSEHSSKIDVRKSRTVVEKNKAKSASRSRQPNAYENQGFGDGRKRKSVKAQIDEKRIERETRRAESSAKTMQQRHQQENLRRRRKTPRNKTTKGR